MEVTMGIEAVLLAAGLGVTAAAGFSAIQSSRQSSKQKGQLESQTRAREKELAADKAADEQAVLDSAKAGRKTSAQKLALTQTSPQGVLGAPNVGRRKLFGN